MLTGVHAGAYAARARRRIVEALRSAGATSEAGARPASGLGLTETPMLKVLRARGIVRDTADGRMYLDVNREEDAAHARRLVSLVVLAAAVLAMVLVFLFR